MLDIWTNLALRQSDGISVSLDYRHASWAMNSDNPTVETQVTVKRGNETLFTLQPEPAQALDCFYHPFAFAHRALTAGKLDRMPSFS